MRNIRGQNRRRRGQARVDPKHFRLRCNRGVYVASPLASCAPSIASNGYRLRRRLCGGRPGSDDGHATTGARLHQSPDGRCRMAANISAEVESMTSERDSAWTLAYTGVALNSPSVKLLRRYWHPMLLSNEVLPRSLTRIELLGETFVVFRLADGQLGLVPEHCPHRGASLAYGFIESD